MVAGLVLGGQAPTQARSVDANVAAQSGPKGDLPDFLQNMPADMRLNHGKYDNALTAAYEQWLAGQYVAEKGSGSGSGASGAAGPFSPLYGPDVRMSNGNLLSSGQNEFQIDINPTDSHFSIGTSNAPSGVGIFRTTGSGQTWTSRAAPAPAHCCDPAVAYSYNGDVYVGVLSTSPAAEYVIRSTDNGSTWSNPSTVAMPDRNNLVVDNGATSPRRGTIYTTYSDLPATNRIKGYKSTDNGATWGAS